MKRNYRVNITKTIFVILLFTVLAFVPTLNADELERVTEGFYAGLADIIENDMNNPDKCVIGAENYFNKNEATVQKNANYQKSQCSRQWA